MNLCCACGEDFGSLSGFDAHRVGKYEYRWSPEQDGRRCLDEEELLALRWHRDMHGRWRTPITKEDRERLASLR
jgi:hypothetical protein